MTMTLLDCECSALWQHVAGLVSPAVEEDTVSCGRFDIEVDRDPVSYQRGCMALHRRCFVRLLLQDMSAMNPKQEWQAGPCDVRLLWRHLSLAALAQRSEVGMTSSSLVPGLTASNCTFSGSMRSVTLLAGSLLDDRAAYLSCPTQRWRGCLACRGSGQSASGQVPGSGPPCRSAAWHQFGS
jgi:hypothetical protein